MTAKLALKQPSELRIFNGRRYRRYPDSPKRTHRTYFLNGPRLLHREIYAYHHGPIPPGRQVWFKDGDFDNFDPANLVLDTPELKEAALDRAADWHKSAEGLKWHKKQALTLAKERTVALKENKC